jgi:hypothetical protein
MRQMRQNFPVTPTIVACEQCSTIKGCTMRTTTDTQANVCVLICTSYSVHIFGVAHTHETDNLMNNALDTKSVRRAYIEHIHINFSS